MSPHLAAEALEQYVSGALDADAAAGVETHVAGCEACAKLLRREAAVEVALFELASGGAEVVALPARRAWRTRVLLAAAAAVLALTAAGVSLLSEREPSREAAPLVRRCVDAPQVADCVSQAQFDGVITIGPGREPIVPRYEVEGGAL